MFSLSLVLHVIAGFVALITLWLPLFLEKVKSITVLRVGYLQLACSS